MLQSPSRHLKTQLLAFDISFLVVKSLLLFILEDMASIVPPSGVWCPAITFFNPDTDELALDAQARYFHYLSTTGLAGLVILGTNAETFLLTREERKELIVTARRAVGQFPLMAGVGGHSTRQVLEHIADAADAGANSVLLLPPAYFGPRAHVKPVQRSLVFKGCNLVFTSLWLIFLLQRDIACSFRFHVCTIRPQTCTRSVVSSVLPRIVDM